MVPCSKIKAFSYFLLVLLLCVPIAGAVEITGAELYTAPNNYTVGDDLFTELSVKIGHYNQNLEKVPAVFDRFVGSEEIAGRIKLENGTMLNVTLLMRGGGVGDFYSYNTSTDPKSAFGPSITVETNEQTVREILDSKDPLRKTVESMNNESFNVETTGFFRKTALWTLQQLYS
jgi:hypothetical protein